MPTACMYVCKSLFKHGKSSVKLKLKTKTNYNCFTWLPCGNPIYQLPSWYFAWKAQRMQHFLSFWASYSIPWPRCKRSFVSNNWCLVWHIAGKKLRLKRSVLQLIKDGLSLLRRERPCAWDRVGETKWRRRNSGIEPQGLAEQATRPSLCRCPWSFLLAPPQECQWGMAYTTSPLLLTHFVNLKPPRESKVLKLPTCSTAFCSAGRDFKQSSI